MPFSMSSLYPPSVVGGLFAILQHYKLSDCTSCHYCQTNKSMLPLVLHIVVQRQKYSTHGFTHFPFFDIKVLFHYKKKLHDTMYTLQY